MFGLEAFDTRDADGRRGELGPFYRFDHGELAAAGVPAVGMRLGTQFIGQPEDFGRKLVADHLANHCHRVSDEVGPDRDLSGAVEDYRLYLRLGHEVARDERWPARRVGNEVEARRLEVLGGALRR